jgi:lincosamide nucleotidyltransferase A/C/D/E
VIGGQEVVRVIEALEAAGVECWVDGEWGVDALLGRQTRPHQDLDLAIPLVKVPDAVEVLERMGFSSHEDEVLLLIERFRLKAPSRYG